MENISFARSIQILLDAMTEAAKGAAMESFSYHGGPAGEIRGQICGQDSGIYGWPTCVCERVEGVL